MRTFEKKFTDTLVMEARKAKAVEAEITAPDAEPVEPVSDAQAFEKQLDPGTNPKQFDVKPNPALDHHVALTNSQLKSLQTWITEIEGWIERLNGLKPDSIQSQLNSAECDTVFTPIARSETKKVSRIAQDLSGLAESLKGHLMSADTTG